MNIHTHNTKAAAAFSWSPDVMRQNAMEEDPPCLPNTVKRIMLLSAFEHKRNSFRESGLKY